MKLSKNILVLFGSYLGAFALVAMIGRFTVSPLGNAGDDTAGGNDVPAGIVDPVDTDIPAAVTPDTETDAPSVEATEKEDPPQTGGETGETEAPTVYYVKTVTGENGTATGAIGVYSADGELLDVLSTPAVSLPTSDRALLDAGIEVVGDEALAALLEDFGG